MRSIILKCTICFGLLLCSFLAFSQEDWDACNESHGLNVCYKRIHPTCPDPPNGSYVMKVSGIPATANEVVVYLYNFSLSTNEKVVIPKGSTSYELTFDNMSSDYLYHPLVNVDGDALWEGMSFTLKQPEYKASISKEREAGCTGQPVGIASVSFNAGVAPYTWAWHKKGDASFTAHNNQMQVTDMTPGEYFVTVSDFNGCAINSDTVEVKTQDITLSVVKKTNVTCKDTTNGSIEVSVSGAYGDYNLYWRGANSYFVDKNLLVNNTLPADTYMIQVVDEIGCTDETGPETILEPENKIILKRESYKDLACKDMPTGQVTFSVENAVGSVSYQWSDAAESGLIRNDLAADITYYLTVTDENGCQAKNSVKLSQPDTKVVVSVQDFKEPSCFGYSDGSLSVLAEGGQSGVFTYKWNEVVGDASRTDVAAGDYEIVAVDEIGCTDTLHYTLEQPEALSTTFTVTGGSALNPNLVLCSGDEVTISLAVEGGVQPISYKWYDEADFGTQTERTVGAGTFNVVIKDGNGCEQPASTTVMEPEPLTATITEKTSIACNGDLGELQVTVTGGTGAYTYNWSNASTNETTGSVPRGTYSVNVTDENGCSDNKSYELQQPDTLFVHIKATAEACADITKGDLYVDIKGGTAPFEYHWNTGATTETLGNLSAAVYSVTVTDQHGCFDDDNIDMNYIKKFTIKSSKTNVTCVGRSDGTARIQASYGYNPKVFWSNGDSTMTIKNLPVGSYTARVVDNRGCEKKSTIEIDVVPPMVVSSLVTEPSACTLSTGAATIKITQGQKTFSYVWKKGDEVVESSKKATVSSLSAGDYIVSVTDRNGCVLDTSFTIPKKANVRVAAFSEDTIIRCLNGQVGTATAVASNGVEPYQYLWSNGSDGDNVSNLSAGTYSVTATDAEGCEASAEIHFVEDELLTIIDKEQKNVSCFGDATGYLVIGVEGGVAPYTISWSNGPTTYSNQNLSAGDYTVTVSDSKGCSVTRTYTITQPQKIAVTIQNQKSVTCTGYCDASAEVVVTGGVSPYTINWSSGETGESAVALCVGTQQIFVEDANKCSETFSFDVSGRVERLMVANTVTQSPICSEIVPSGEITVTATGSLNGDYFYEWKNDGSVVSTTNAVTGVSAGAYALHLTDGTCVFDTTITLSHELGATAQFDYQYSNCDGDAYKIVISNEDIANYTYQWSNGNDTQMATGLKNGTYSVVATDKDGCVLTKSLQVEEKVLEIKLEEKNDVNCFGKPNGSATVSLQNADGVVQYNWFEKLSKTAVGSGAEIQNLAKGEYFVVAYDANHAACADTLYITIEEPAEIQLYFAEESPSYCKLPNGSVSVEIVGATLPITSYEWTDNTLTVLGTTAVCTNVPSETDIKVSIVDAVGCQASGTTQISDVSNFSLQGMQTADIHCIGGNEAALEVFTINGYSPFTYEWSHDASVKTNMATGLSSGVYTVTVTDTKNCSATYKFDTVKNPQPLYLEFEETPRIECKGGTGVLAAVTTGGWPTYSYEWYDENDAVLQNSEKSDIENCKKGLYKVKVTDKYGCESAVFTYEMTEPDELIVKLSVDVTECGENSEVGKITVDTIYGGWDNSPYRFKWGTLSEDKTWYSYEPYEKQALTNLPAGTFACTVTYTEDPTECYVEEELYTNPVMPDTLETMIQHTRCSYYTDTEIQNGVTDGSIEITQLLVSKGNYDKTTRTVADLADYTFEWNDVKKQKTTQAVNLQTGEYEVTVTGKNNCYKTFPAGTIDSYVKMDAYIYATDDSTVIRKLICLDDSLNVSAHLETQFDYNYTPVDNSVSYSWTAVEKNCSSSIGTPDEASTWVDPLTTYYADSTQIQFSYGIDGCHSKPVTYTICHYDSVNFAIEMYDTTGVYVGIDSVDVLQGARYLLLPVEDPWFVDKVGENGVMSILWRSFKTDKMEKGQILDVVTDEKTYERSGHAGLAIRLDEPEYVYATATTKHGCRERTYIFVNVLSSNFVPSGFSPNGDGVNDMWVIPYLNNCPKAKVHVYNRWGVLVYENHVEYATQPWNGTSLSGNALPMGTYYYVIEYNDANNTPTKTGSISIIR